MVIEKDTAEFHCFMRYLNSTTNDLHFILTKNWPAFVKKTSMFRGIKNATAGIDYFHL